jgi:hypothetical protein
LFQRSFERRSSYERLAGRSVERRSSYERLGEVVRDVADRDVLGRPFDERGSIVRLRSARSAAVQRRFGSWVLLAG